MSPSFESHHLHTAERAFHRVLEHLVYHPHVGRGFVARLVLHFVEQEEHNIDRLVDRTMARLEWWGLLQ